MKVVEYWHGTIKNYRYDGDVSATDYSVLTDSVFRVLFAYFDESMASKLVYKP